MTVPARRTRLFLDANVLVSAAWKSDSKVLRLWQITGIELVTSNIVVEECRRNLPHSGQLERLAELLRSVRVLVFRQSPMLEDAPSLPQKDQHVLAAAVLARANFLVTGDRAHFGAWYGSSILGVRVEPPASFPAILQEP
jgi:predicted nucleic acid-binding protein